MCLVDPASGRLTLTEIDFTIRGPLPLVHERSYRSTNIWQSDIGKGWGHSFAVQLWLTEDESALVFRDTDGRRIPLPVPPAGETAFNTLEHAAISHVPSARIPWPTLSPPADGIYAISTGKGPTYVFDARTSRRCPLRGLADRNGNLALIESGTHGFPVRLYDPEGRVLEFVRDRGGMLQTIAFRSGAAEASRPLIEYEQDAAGNLVSVRDGAGTRRYAYDEAHRLTWHSDRLGKECLSVFEATGRCTLTEGPAGVKRRSYRYEPSAQRTVVTDSLQNATVIEYDALERVLRTIDRAGGVSAFEYDAAGRLVQATDQLGHTTSVLFNAVGAPAGKVRPDGSTVAIVTDDTGEVSRIVTSEGAATTFQRDSLGRVTVVEQPGGGRTEVGYDAHGRIAQVKTPFGKEVALQWSPDGRRLVESDADGVLTDQHLDEFGRAIGVRDAVGALTSYEYDPSGEIARITNPDGTHRTFGRDPEGRLLSWTAEDGVSTRWMYDAAGRCVEIVVPDGSAIRCAYDSENRLVGVADAGGRRHEFRYTPEGLVAEASFPDGRLLAFRHDAAGRIIGMRHPDGTFTSVTRDDRGRIAAAEYPDGTVKRAVHDAESRWIFVQHGEHEIARVLTPDGQAIEERQDQFRLFRQFGDAGELRSVTGSDGRRVSHTYDADGRVVQSDVVNGRWSDDAWEPTGAARTHRFEYDRVGNLVRWTAPSGVVETRGYDVRRRLVDQVIAVGDRTVLHRTYSYDAAGRVTEINDSRRGRSRFAFDALGRLVGAAQRDTVRRFAWGASGERTGDLRYASPFRVQQAGDLRYQYDDRGNVVRRSGPWGTQEFTWTPHGLVAAARLSGDRLVEFAYDPHDRLVSRSFGSQVRHFCWDDEMLWGFEDERGPRVGFVSVPGLPTAIEQSVGDRVFSIHVNHIGTVQELIDASGEVVWENPAGVWGESPFDTMPADVDCVLGFPGQIRDEITGLFYNRNRFYDAEIGRYLTPDPMGIFGGLDPYRYVTDPINAYDPKGLACRGKNDDPTLYRGDSRPPDEICANGFAPSNPAANISVMTHVNGVPTTGSNWVSTSYEGSTAERFAHSSANQYGGQPLVYVIDNPGCGVEVDCDPDVLAWEAQYGPAGSEQEIAFDGGLPASRILGFYHADDPTSFQACP